MTSYCLEYSCILFRYFKMHWGAPESTLRVPEKHIVLLSAWSGAYGSFWKDRCGYSEKLSCWVMTSEPFYILLMKDFHLSCSGNALQIGDWERCNGVATVHLMRQYLWRVGDFGAQQLSYYCRWRTRVVCTPEIELCAPLPVGDPVNTTTWASSTDLSPWTNLGANNAQSGWDRQKWHWQDDTWNWFQTRHLLACRTCKSHPRGAAHPYWGARKRMEYPPCVIWYLNIQSETIK